MYSDNGTNLRGASAELKEFWINLDKAAVQDFASGLHIQWIFNPPKAPHMGGAWERLIRSVKTILHAIVKDQILTDPQLYTLLTEVESIINCRPLTKVSDDVNDYDALTPNHLLLGMHRNWASVAGVDESQCVSRKKYRHWE